MVRHYKELGIHRLSVEVRTTVFALSKQWPPEEKYDLTSQVRRASRSVGANIAEAWAKRRYRNHFISKLTDAHAEIEETGEHLDVALECEYLSEAAYADLTGKCRQIAAGLVKMMREPERWCGPSRLVREEGQDYETSPPPPSPPPPNPSKA